MTLPIDQWREVYRLLQNDHGWRDNLSEIESQCQRNRQTCQFPLAMTWPMCATLRESNPELVAEIGRQMNAQCITTTW